MRSDTKQLQKIFTDIEIALLDTYTIPMPLLLKYKTLVTAYLSNGMCKNKAYIDTYNIQLPTKHIYTDGNGKAIVTDSNSKLKDDYTKKMDIINTECQRVFNSPVVVDLLVEQLRTIGVDKYVSKEFVYNSVIELLQSAKAEPTKSRMIELLAKLGHHYTDTVTNVAFINDIDGDIKAKVRDRIDKERAIDV